jgi:hypothetical protein
MVLEQLFRRSLPPYSEAHPDRQQFLGVLIAHQRSLVPGVSNIVAPSCYPSSPARSAHARRIGGLWIPAEIPRDNGGARGDVAGLQARLGSHSGCWGRLLRGLGADSWRDSNGFAPAGSATPPPIDELLDKQPVVPLVNAADGWHLTEAGSRSRLLTFLVGRVPG